MLVAHDKDGNRIYANAGIRYTECFCPECKEPLRHRIGQHNKPHFAHKENSDCLYGQDKDAKGEWHIRMQELFPPESLEVRFCDDEGNLKHIADVYLKESNTVIEFQKSRISAEDFFSRTMFHTSHGRRVVWVFYEGKPDKEFGKFRPAEFRSMKHKIYQDLCFDWLYSPRKIISSVWNRPSLDNIRDFSVCVYYDDSSNIVHHIISQEYDYKEVTFSVHPIELKGDMDINEFFIPESYWLSQSPYKEIIEEENRWRAERMQRMRQQRRTYVPLPRTRGPVRHSRRM